MGVVRFKNASGSDKPKDRHRKGYYHDYNLAHPERLARIGVDVESVKCKDGTRIVRGEDGRLYKEIVTTEKRPIDSFSLALERHDGDWTIDDFEEND